ncbi:MAG: hypothetical protein H5T33_08420, partial [Candidatus Methanosuratus sp.]|nr:hypothetical protein [Candidatus Methanosuratincola sp.]
VKGVELAQADDGVAMKVFTGEELAVKEVMGKAPANRYFIHLEAVSHAACFAGSSVALQWQGLCLGYG